MVSDALRAFSGHFQHWSAQGGVDLDGRVCQMLADQFKELAEDATTLEGQPIPASQRGSLPREVVNLDVERVARLVRRQGGDWGVA